MKTVSGIVSGVILETLVLGILAHRAGAVALPNGLYDPKACGGAACFQVTNTTSVGIGSGISGAATGPSGIGLVGSSQTYYGVYGVSNGSSSTAVGVLGTSASGYGVYGSTAAVGVNNPNPRAGVYGTSTSGAGTGVWGSVTGAGATGVYAENTNNGIGLYASAIGSGTPVAVYAYTNSPGYAVFGDNTNSTGWAGYFNGRAFTTAGVWTASDARLKKNIKDSPYGINEVLRLRPVTYNWRKPGNDATQLGLIAQEVQNVVPEMVTTDGVAGMLSVNYAGMVPLLIRATQDQQKTIDKLEGRIAKLEGRSSGNSVTRLPGGTSLIFAAGLLPLGLFIKLRRRKANQS